MPLRQSLQIVNNKIVLACTVGFYDLLAYTPAAHCRVLITLIRYNRCFGNNFNFLLNFWFIQDILGSKPNILYFTSSSLVEEKTYFFKRQLSSKNIKTKTSCILITDRRFILLTNFFLWPSSAGLCGPCSERAIALKLNQLTDELAYTVTFRPKQP